MADPKEKDAILKQFQTIPGVGKSISQDLYDLGFRSVSGLKSEDPESMYVRLMHLKRGHADRCMLYVFRCAVYFASEKNPDPELLKWWNWQDK